MSILALDLGTNCGFALLHPTGLMMSGTWQLKSKRMESVGMRYVRFREHLNAMKVNNGVRQVYFEEVRRHMGVDAAHMYGGYLASLQAFCVEHEIEYQGVPVGEIKKWFTGNGAASKVQMIAEAQRRGYEPVDDNEADAIAILLLKTEGT